MDWKIYNRWGQLVFESNNPFIGWDGTFHGAVQPIGVYAYTLDATFFDGTKVRRKGRHYPDQIRTASFKTARCDYTLKTTDWISVIRKNNKDGKNPGDIDNVPGSGIDSLMANF